MSKIYVITEASFEYNDEIYYQGESEGGEPVLAYSTREVAEKALDIKTREWVDGTRTRYSSLSDYGYEVDEVVDPEKFSELSGVALEEVEQAWRAHDGSFDEMALDNLDATVQSLNLTPYKITEIELR